MQINLWRRANDEWSDISLIAALGYVVAAAGFAAALIGAMAL